MARLILSLGLVILLAACGSGRPVASEFQVEQARYADPGPPALTLITSINIANGSGAHSALVIDASERVIFDPAGNFRSPDVPQRGDVLFGISPRVLQAYLDFQSETGYRVVAQRIEVSPGVAQLALQRALENGPAMQGLCTDNVSALVSKLPGFTDLHVVLFPRSFMNQFGRVPGVTRSVYVSGRLISGPDLVRSDAVAPSAVLPPRVSALNAAGASLPSVTATN